MINEINKKRNVFKQYSIKNLQYILLAFGLALGVTDYLIDKYVHGIEEQIMWLAYVLLLMCLGYRVGKFIKEMYTRVYRDPQTGLFNRGYFYFRFNSEIEKINNNKSCLSLAMVDIDNFKSINDIYGHLEGDNVIKNISAVLNQNVRKTDAVIRWGGDEFSLIFPNTNEAESLEIAERIRRVIEEQECFIGNVSYKVTISVGIYTISEKIGQDKFLSLADKALYKAKKDKNSVAVFKL